MKRSATIDVIWFNERGMPSSFFEVESSTDIQNSLTKYNDLQDFFVNMYIVADKKRHADYESKIARSSFEGVKSRVNFLDYASLVKQYEHAISYGKIDVIIR